MVNRNVPGTMAGGPGVRHTGPGQRGLAVSYSALRKTGRGEMPWVVASAATTYRGLVSSPGGQTRSSGTGAAGTRTEQSPVARSRSSTLDARAAGGPSSEQRLSATSGRTRSAAVYADAGSPTDALGIGSDGIATSKAARRGLERPTAPARS